MFNYMLRVNLTIAIVDMVVPTNLTLDNSTDSNSSIISEPEGSVRYLINFGCFNINFLHFFKIFSPVQDMNGMHICKT